MQFYTADQDSNSQWHDIGVAGNEILDLTGGLCHGILVRYLRFDGANHIAVEITGEGDFISDEIVGTWRVSLARYSEYLTILPEKPYKELRIKTRIKKPTPRSLIRGLFRVLHKYYVKNDPKVEVGIDKGRLMRV